MATKKEVMKTINVCFEVEMPEDITFDQAYEFLAFELGYMGGLSGENPLSDTDLSSLNVTDISIR